MTQDEIEKLKALVAAANKEDWKVQRCDDGSLQIATYGDVICVTDGNLPAGDRGAKANFALIVALHKHGPALLDDAIDHEKSFKLRWDADMRAIKRWQAAGPGRENTWPDHADMVVWLLEERDRLAKELTDLAEDFELADDRESRESDAASPLRELLRRHGLLKEKTS